MIDDGIEAGVLRTSVLIKPLIVEKLITQTHETLEDFRKITELDIQNVNIDESNGNTDE